MTMTPRRLAIAAAVLGLALCPALVRAQNREQLQMNADIRQISELLSKLQLSVNQLAALLADQIKTLNKKIDDQADANVKAFADQRLQLTNDATALTTLRTSLGDLTTRVLQVLNEQGAQRTAITQITQQLNTLTNLIMPSTVPDQAAGTATPAPGAPASVPASAQPGPLGSVTMPDSPNACSRRAQDDYLAGHSSSAAEGFQDCLDRFPTIANADELTFYMGEALKDQKKYPEALKAYQKVITDYKTSTLAPDAYYSEGLVYLLMNQKANAQTAFNGVIKAYPESVVATEAKQQLQRLATSK